MAFNLARLLKLHGVRRRVLRLRPIKPDLRDRRALEAILLEMVTFAYSFGEQLAAAVPVPGVVTDAPAEDIDRIVSIFITQTNGVMARLRLRVRGWAQRTDKAHREKFKGGILAASGVDVGTVLDPHGGDRTVGEVVTRNVSLIRDLGDEARKRMTDIVIAAVTQRRHPRDVAKDIAAAEGMSRKRALNIAADQANKLNAALDRARQKEAGIDGFTWRHSGKVHARPEHLARDGDVFPWDTQDIEPGDFPGEPPFCGCIAQATLIDVAGQSEGDAPDDEPTGDE